LGSWRTVYRWMPFLGKDWEERKIRELKDQDRRWMSCAAR